MLFSKYVLICSLLIVGNDLGVRSKPVKIEQYEVGNVMQDGAKSDVKKRDIFDVLLSSFFYYDFYEDSDEDDSDEELYLLCRNCTVVVQKGEATISSGPQQTAGIGAPGQNAPPNSAVQSPALNHDPNCSPQLQLTVPAAAAGVAGQNSAPAAVKPPRNAEPMVTTSAMKVDEPAKKTEEPPKHAEEPVKKAEEPEKKAKEPPKKTMMPDDTKIISSEPEMTLIVAEMTTEDPAKKVSKPDVTKKETGDSAITPMKLADSTVPAEVAGMKTMDNTKMQTADQGITAADSAIKTTEAAAKPDISAMTNNKPVMDAKDTGMEKAGNEESKINMETTAMKP